MTDQMLTSDFQNNIERRSVAYFISSLDDARVVSASASNRDGAMIARIEMITARDAVAAGGGAVSGR